ncbi:hypothetical protein ACFE04_001728 [Oxalis oulophora]
MESFLKRGVNAQSCGGGNQGVNNDPIMTHLMVGSAVGDVCKVHETFEEQELAKWKQRAKCFWLKNGDVNSKYFHRQASARRRSNRVSELERDDGSMVSDEAGMRIVVAEYFEKLFEPSTSNSNAVLRCVSKVVTSEDNAALTRNFTVIFQQAMQLLHDWRNANSLQNVAGLPVVVKLLTQLNNMPQIKRLRKFDQEKSLT